MAGVVAPPHIGEIVQNGVLFNAKQWHKPLMGDSLLQSVADLFTLLTRRQIDYVLVGGIALLRYVEGRNTQDIDLIMALDALERLPEIQLHSQDNNFARGHFQGLQIDLLLTRNPLFAKVQHAYTAEQLFFEETIPTATVEGLILLKLYALPSLYRQGDFARVGIYENDVATLIQHFQPDLEPLLAELSLHLSESDLREIRTVLAEIAARIERFQRRAGH